MPVLSLGNIDFQLDQAGLGHLPENLHPYLQDKTSTHQLVTVQTQVGPVEPVDGVTLFDPGHAWRIVDAPPGIAIEIYAGHQPQMPYQQLRLNSELTAGLVTINPTAVDVEPARFALREPLLELWTTFLLLRHRGVLLHGLGIVQDDKGTLFLGQSGAGKSTLAHLLKKILTPITILSDDRLIVQRHNNGYAVFGTPWHGEAQFHSPLHAPLDEIFFLRQAPYNRVSPCTLAESVKNLLACTFIVGWPRNEVTNFAIDYCVELASRVECKCLSFLPDRTVADVLK